MIRKNLIQHQYQRKKIFKLTQNKFVKIKNLGAYDDLLVQGDTLFLADVFNNFRNMRLEM